jgi:diadenosine tetraphosphatase ApaH/serine/threonine PP2A family protein phosphatase
MLAAEILDTFKKLGISAYVEDGKLFCEPGSLLPPDLKPEIRRCKAEIMALLCEPRSNAVMDHLLSRLQAGSRWLTAQHQAWLDSKPDAASDQRFSVALAAWSEMERSLRMVFGYEGCVFGPDQRCPKDAPVICDACVVALR